MSLCAKYLPVEYSFELVPQVDDVERRSEAGLDGVDGWWETISRSDPNAERKTAESYVLVFDRQSNTVDDMRIEPKVVDL